MKINDTMMQALNDQLNFEIHSFHLYLSMAAWLDRHNLGGSAHWMKLQAQEEMSHAMKLYDHLYERQGFVELTALPEPQRQWESPLALFEAALAHEEKVTERFYALTELAQTQKDYTEVAFLQWFITEQTEEEASAEKIISQMKMLAESKSALFMLDRDLGKRAAKA